MIFFDERNRFFESSHVTSEIVYMMHSEEVLINYFRDAIRYQGSLPTQENGWVVAWTVLWTAPFGTLVFHGISDNEKVNDCVPCIRRQRFTRSLHKKAKVYQDRKSSQANFLPFGVRKPKLSCSDNVQTNILHDTLRRKPLQVKKLWRLLFIFSAGFRLSHETSSQRISYFLRITVVDFLFTGYFCHHFCAGLENNKSITRGIPENWAKKLTFQFLFGKLELLLRC